MGCISMAQTLTCTGDIGTFTHPTGIYSRQRVGPNLGGVLARFERRNRRHPHGSAHGSSPERHADLHAFYGDGEGVGRLDARAKGGHSTGDLLSCPSNILHPRLIYVYFRTSTIFMFPTFFCLTKSLYGGHKFSMVDKCGLRDGNRLYCSLFFWYDALFILCQFSTSWQTSGLWTVHIYVSTMGCTLQPDLFCCAHGQRFSTIDGQII